jgi:hypothetical protein
MPCDPPGSACLGSPVPLDDDRQACVGTVYERESLPTALLLVVDSSEQMAVAEEPGQPTRWDIVSEALVRFVSDEALNPGSVGLALASTSADNGCDPDAELAPSVGMVDRSRFLELLGPLLSASETGGDPASEAVLSGMFAFASEWARASPPTWTTVLFVGGPSLLPCPGVEGFVGDFGVVFGAVLLDADLPSDPCEPRSTFRGFDSRLGADALVDELLDVHRRLQPQPEYQCSFEVPTAPNDMSDLAYALAWFAYERPGETLEFPLLGSVSECADSPNGGFYYEREQETGTPQSVVLCPCSCEALVSSAPNRVEVGFPCETDV